MRRVLGFVVLACVCLVARRVAAGGLEYAGAGAESLARGGATTALADDPMVLSTNPAGLAELRGNQIMLDIQFTAMHACIDPIGYYGWGVYGGGAPARFSASGQTLNLALGDVNSAPAAAYYNGQLDTVCMRPNMLPIPQIGFTFRVSERLGVGFGLMFPAATPQGEWGGENGVINTPAGLRPAPTRYMLMNSGTLGVFPTVGVGYRLTKWLRIGAAFEWGIINVDNLNMAAASGGTSPASDILAHIKATDWFVPAVNASIHIVPIDALDIVAAFRAQGDLDATGSLFLTTGVFNPVQNPYTSEEKVSNLHQRFPWKLRGGVRYGSRLAPRPSGTGHDEGKTTFSEPVHDAMQDERWDVELDVEYQMNSRNQAQDIAYNPGQAVIFQNAMTNGLTSVPFPMAPRTGATTDTIVTKAWKNQISARLGGSYNIIPGRFSISLGAHYENRGVDPSYMQIDYWPVSRFGLHAGVKVRVGRAIDLIASYAHIFQETLTVGAPSVPPEHVPPEPAANTIYGDYAMTGVVDHIAKNVGAVARGGEAPVKPEPSPGKIDGTARLTQNTTTVPPNNPPFIINSGTYRSGIDVVAVGVRVHY
jgi:long-subunit fatty acid transport protein